VRFGPGARGAFGVAPSQAGKDSLAMSTAKAGSEGAEKRKQLSRRDGGKNHGALEIEIVRKINIKVNSASG